MMGARKRNLGVTGRFPEVTVGPTICTWCLFHWDRVALTFCVIQLSPTVFFSVAFLLEGPLL